MNIERAEMRWLIDSQVSEAVYIDECCFPDPLEPEHFEFQRGRARMCVMCDGQMLGFFITDYDPHLITILRLAVHPRFRRRGIGTMMIRRIRQKLSRVRPLLFVILRESNLDGQLFYRSMGFEWIRTLEQNWEDTGEDGYVMRSYYESEVMV